MCVCVERTLHTQPLAIGTLCRIPDTSMLPCAVLLIRRTVMCRLVLTVTINSERAKDVEEEEEETAEKSRLTCSDCAPKAKTEPR